MPRAAPHVLTAAIALAAAASARPAPARPAPAAAAAHPVPRIVAAENFYGDVARQLAGERAEVTSILANPDQDPHLFEASPSVARDLAAADIVVANGVGYDPWIATLLAASPSPTRQTIVVAGLVGRHDGDNPHVWYDPATMPAYARALARALLRADPAHAADTGAALARVLDSLAAVQARVTRLRAQFGGATIGATEPVFGDMAAALGLHMRNERFQLAVMNGTEPAASDVARFEEDLRRHRIALLVTNSQATDTAAARLEAVARQSGVPVVGVSETEPAGATYQAWMLAELDAVAGALGRDPPRP